MAFLAAFLWILPLSNSNKCLAREDTNTDINTKCASLLEKLETNCVAKYIQKLAWVREQVMCNYISGPGLVHPVEYYRDELIKSARIQQRLDRDIEGKVTEEIQLLLKDELERIAVESERIIGKSEQLLEKLEKQYLVMLSNVIKEMLVKEPLSTASPTAPASTTYLPGLSDHMKMGYYESHPTTLPSHYTFSKTSATTITPSKSPQQRVVMDSRDRYMEWRCLMSLWRDARYPVTDHNNMNVNGITNEFQGYDQAFGLVKRQPLRMRVMWPDAEYDWGGKEDRVEGWIASGTTLVLSISFKMCGINTSYMGGDYLSWAIYSGVKLSYDEAGWLIMNYTHFDSHQLSLTDPLAGNNSDSKVVFISGMGSEAKPKHCSNKILGPGLYRMFNNKTCQGIPMFSKRAASLDRKCTDLMWGGIEISFMWVTLYRQDWFEECRVNFPTTGMYSVD
jgi:hypothetical protein